MTLVGNKKNNTQTNFYGEGHTSTIHQLWWRGGGGGWVGPWSALPKISGHEEVKDVANKKRRWVTKRSEIRSEGSGVTVVND